MVLPLRESLQHLWPHDPQEIRGPGIHAMQQESPSGVHIRKHGNTIQQSFVGLGSSGQVNLDEFVMAKRCAQHLDALQRSKSQPFQTDGASGSSACATLSNSSQAGKWMPAEFHTCCPSVDPDARITPQLQTSSRHPNKRTTVRRRGTNCCRQSGVCLRTNSIIIRGSPCSPPSPWEMRWVTPSSLLHILMVGEP